ncbi:hypothetical protein ACFE04_016607 [Oxalis oulophora]
MISSSINCSWDVGGSYDHIHHHHHHQPSKLYTLNTNYAKSRSFLGFNKKSKHYPFTFSALPTVNSHTHNPNLGFKLQGSQKSPPLPTNRKKKKYGGMLPSILRSLDTDINDIEITLHNCCQNLNPKEQTVILKEQRRWQKVVRVFEYFKSQAEYVPNVIHYNIVLRALGRAQRWDELRLCWIDMAKNGVLPTNNTYGMLIDVYGKSGLVKEAVLWIKHMRIRGIFPDEVTMNTVVRVLKEAGEFDRADRFYKDWRVGRVEGSDLELDSMIDYGDKNGSSPISLKHFLSTELFRIGGRNPVPEKRSSADSENYARKPKLTSTYNTLIDLYGKAGRLKDAAKVFDEMLKSGVAVDTITFNTMIYTCGSHGHLSEAESLLSKMEEKGISPDTKTYNIFLSLYADAGNIDAALWCYRRIREVGLYPDTVTHRALICILCERNMIEEVVSVIKGMENSGLRVNEHSVPVVMKMYINKGLLDEANDFYEHCQFDMGFSSKTRAAIIDAYAEKAFWAEAESVFYGKPDSTEKKDVVEYNVMIKAYGKAKLYDRAFSLFREMRNFGTWPDECTYNSLIQMFSGGDLVNQSRELLTEMQESGFRPQCATFSSVIGCYARLGQLSDAVDVFHEMKKSGVKPNEIVYGSLINGFAETSDVLEALQYYRMMKESDIPANQIVLTSLIKAYSKVGCMEEAKQLYERMKNMEGGPDIIASNSMISLYADLGLVSEAKLIFDDLREKGQADGVSFATMMYLYKNMGMFDEVIDVAEEMKQSGLLIDCTSYNKVMSCYVMNGQLSECGKLLQEMVRRKIFPESGTFKVLFTLLKKGNIPMEAVQQLESAYREGKNYARQAVVTLVYSVLCFHGPAIESCEQLMKADVALDRFVYNVIISTYRSSGDIDMAMNIYMKLRDKGLEPDLVTFINLVGCYGKAGMFQGIKGIHGQLKHGQIEPNESLYNAVIDAYQNCKKKDLAELVSQEMRLAFEPQQNSDSEFVGRSDENSDSEYEYQSGIEDI